MLRRRSLLLPSILCALCAGASASAVNLDANVDIVVLSGDPVPNSAESFSSFGDPVLNQPGQVAFAYQADGGSMGIARGSATTLEVIVASGQESPDANGTFVDFAPLNDSGPQYAVALNDAGDVVFIGVLEGTAGDTADDRGVFLSDGSSTAAIARKGQPAPDGLGGFNGVFSTFKRTRLNQSGSVALLATTSDNLAPFVSGSSNIFRKDGTDLSAVLRSIYAGAVRVDGPREIAFSDSGHLSYGEYTRDEFLVGTSGLRSNDGNTLEIVLNAGQIAGGGPGTFGSGWIESLNKYVASDDGQIAAASTLPTLPGSINSGIYFYDGDELIEIGREGSEIAGDVQSVPIGFAMNDAGRITFRAGTTLYAWDGLDLNVLATVGQTAPDGDGTLDLDGQVALNESGQLAFASGISQGTETGLLVHDGAAGLVLVVRQGDGLLGSTITGLRFLADNVAGDEGNGLNDSGRLAFHFTLADGRSGIGIWSPVAAPSVPSIGAIGAVASAICLAATGFAARRRPLISGVAG